MPEHTDLTSHDPARQEPDSPSSPAAEPAGGRAAEASEAGEPGRLMVAVSELTAHPGNVREDLELTTEFCASVAAEGVRVPLLITTSDRGYRVIEGHRRLAAAARAGLDQVPCVVDPSRSGDEAGQYLDMVLANSGAYRRNFAAVEEAAALFAAHQAGATRTRLRKATGRKAEDIKTALKAGQLSPQARESAGELARQLDLEELALLAEFGQDPGAISQLLDARQRGYGMEYTAERIRRDRADAAEHERMAGELRSAGYQITDDVPSGGALLSQLRHDGEPLTPEGHATCPGRGAYFPHWDLLTPVHYCASPQEHGHVPLSRSATRAAANGAGVDDGDANGPAMSSSPGRAAEEPPSHARRLVIEGNRAWDAAGQVRRRWLADVLFTRRSAPREVAAYAARQLLSMPEPLRAGLAIAPGRTSFSEITRQDAAGWLNACDSTAAARLPLLILAPIAVAYEHAMTDGLGRATWRTDCAYSPCPRDEAGRYLGFLASLGYQLAPVEQAVASGTPYTGDNPEDLPNAGDGDEPASPEPGEANPDDAVGEDNGRGPVGPDEAEGEQATATDSEGHANRAA
jgi:ParB family chromosome partitioning protein